MKKSQQKRLLKLEVAYSRELIFFGLILLCLVVLANTFLACSAVEKLNDWAGWKDDHLAEEVTEEVIENQTGVDADLTPRSPENE